MTHRYYHTQTQTAYVTLDINEHASDIVQQLEDFFKSEPYERPKEVTLNVIADGPHKDQMVVKFKIDSEKIKNIEFKTLIRSNLNPKYKSQ